MGLLLMLGSLAAMLVIASLIAPVVGSTASEYIGGAAFLVMVWGANAFWRRRRKNPTMMDAVVHVAHGQHRPTKSADLERAVTLAHEDLLQERAALQDVQDHAAALHKGPMPYSTHDLAAATALAFFRDTKHAPVLAVYQEMARRRVANWRTAGKVNALLADAFEKSVGKFHERGSVPDRYRQSDPRSNAPPIERRDATGQQFRSYAHEVAFCLTKEFGVDDGRRLASDQQLQRIIEVYKAEGISASKAADYVIAKLKWGPKNDTEHAVQREVAEEFGKYGVEFMSMDPEMHFSILREAILFKRVPRTVEMFFEIAEQIGRDCEDDQQKADLLADVYRKRLDLLVGTGLNVHPEELPQSYRRFL